MSDIGTMVADLIKAGCAPDVAAQVVAEAFVAGAGAGTFRGIPVDSAAEKRRAYDRERKRKSTGIPPDSAETPVSPIDTKIKNSKKQNSDRPSRGTRIAADWIPGPDGHAFALAEGLSVYEIGREAARFRDYWGSRAGAGGVKTNWMLTWQNWVRTTAERLGKTPRSTASTGTETGFYAAFGSPEQDAWDRYGQAQKGKSFPRDKSGGWRHPTQWPPGYTSPETPIERPPAPLLRAM